jgi:hypothetical protein
MVKIITGGLKARKIRLAEVIPHATSNRAKAIPRFFNSEVATISRHGDAP